MPGEMIDLATDDGVADAYLARRDDRAAPSVRYRDGAVSCCTPKCLG